jgi:hypothetical protein
MQFSGSGHAQQTPLPLPRSHEVNYWTLEEAVDLMATDVEVCSFLNMT